MAAPHVTGIAAVAFGLNPNADALTIESTIVGDATPGVVASVGTGSPNRLAYLDAVAPTATAPTMAMRTGVALSGTAIPVAVSWSGADAGSGVARYELAKSIDGGKTWTTLSSSVTGTAFSLYLPPSGTVRFRVRAIDRAGNTGAWMTGPVLNPRIVQESGPGLAYSGTWTSATSAAYSGGNLKHSSTAGATATYTFMGRSVAIVTTKATTRGVLRIYVDGSTTPVTIDCYSATTVYQAQVWQQAWAATGSHTIKIVIVGTSGRPRVDVDAFAVAFTDTTAPAAPTVPATALRTGASVSGTTLPVTVSWTGADNAGGSGIARYELAKSTDGGTVWTTVSTTLDRLPLTPPPSPRPAPSASASARSTGRATSAPGPRRVRCSPRSSSRPPPRTPAPGRPPAPPTTPAARSGTPPPPGPRATYTFTGRSVALVTTRATSRGALRIYLDGSATPVTVDTYAAATAYQAQVWTLTFATSGTHTVKVVVVGTAGHPRVDLDAFSVIK